MQKTMILKDKNDVILLYEVLRNSRCKPEMELINDYELLIRYKESKEDTLIDALTTYSLIALIDDVVYTEFANIQEEQFIELSATIVYDEELNNITQEILRDYLAENFTDDNEIVIRLHGLRNFPMYDLIPLIKDYVTDFIENEVIEESILIEGERFYDETLLDVVVFFKDVEVWVRTKDNTEHLVEDILLKKNVFMDINEMIEGVDDAIIEGNAIYVTALVLVAGTEKISYYKKDEEFVLRLVELFAQNGLKIKLNELED